MDKFGKFVVDWNPWLIPELGRAGKQNPPPPPLPSYDPALEAPKWDWHRIRWGPTKPEVLPGIPKRGGLPASDDMPDWRGIVKNNVVPMDKITKYDFGQPEYQSYYYFDTPDYADPFKKLWSAFKILGHLGLIWGCSHAVMRSMNFTVKTNKFLLTNIVIPFVGGGLTLAATAITVANVRGKKDDMYNYLAGAMVAGVVTGGRTNYVRHMNHTVLWLTAAAGVKYMNEVNGVLLPVINPRRRNLGIHGNNAQEGIWSGELGPRWRGQQVEDPGRPDRHLL